MECNVDILVVWCSSCGYWRRWLWRAQYGDTCSTGWGRSESFTSAWPATHRATAGNTPTTRRREALFIYASHHGKLLICLLIQLQTLRDFDLFSFVFDLQTSLSVKNRRNLLYFICFRLLLWSCILLSISYSLCIIGSCFLLSSFALYKIVLLVTMYHL